MLNRLRSVFRALRFRGEFEQGMTEELNFHIEQYAEDLVRSGLTPDEALRRARLEFGGLNSVKGECRQARRLHWPDELGRQLRYAARLLQKTPGFTVTALLTLALCLGANLTIFAVIQSILLRPLPFAKADRLVTIFNTYPKAGVDRDGASVTNYYERRGHIPAFESLSIYAEGTAIAGEPGSTNREPITRVSAEFFDTLGRGPELGRAFSDSEMSQGADHVAILTNTYWRDHFHSDPAAIGRSIRVDGVRKTIVGILPSDFRFLSSRSQVYLPRTSQFQDRTPLQRHSGGNVTQMIARLKAGVTLAQAQSQIDAQNNALEVDGPQSKMMAEAGFRSLVVPLHADHVAAIKPTLLLLQAGALLLLLIGTVNLLNLLLIRANGRAKELAVRQALGSSRLHVVSEVVVETTLLTFAGGLLGIAGGATGIGLLARFGADRLPLGAQLSFDSTTALVGLVAAILMGPSLAAPITWFHLRRDPAYALQAETRGGTSGRAAQTLRHAFLVAQVALSFLLLTGAGLLGVSLKHAAAVSPGFRPDHLLTGQISIAGKDYRSASADLIFTERMVHEMSRQPGVRSVGVITNLPFSGRSGKSAAKIKGRVLQPGEAPRGHYSYEVGGDYFQALGFHLRQGRFLADGDARQNPQICVVDDDFAHFYWPHGSALGQSLFHGSEDGKDSEAFTIVGVVGAVKQAGLTEETAQGAIYYPYRGNESDIFVAVRASVPPEALAATLRRMVRQIDSDLPVNDLRAMDSRIADSLLARRSPALLAGLFSGVALLLTALGTYGVLSYAVAQRRREIGVRMALGARPQQIRSQFFNLALRLVGCGWIIGVVGSWLASRAMQTLLFHVPAFDLPTLAGVMAVMSVISVIACLVPSQRAARMSPVEALAGD